MKCGYCEREIKEEEIAAKIRWEYPLQKTVGKRITYTVQKDNGHVECVKKAQAYWECQVPSAILVATPKE